MTDTMSFIGQIFGMIAVILGFISFQMKTRTQLLIIQTITTITFCIHYGLIGATSGLVMNLLGIVRNLAYYNKDKKIFSGLKCPVFFTVLMGIAGILSWEAWYSIFVLLGLMINSFCLSFDNPQNIRKSILVTSPLVLIYDGFVSSYGGIIYESVVIVSSLIGIVRYRKNKTAQNT